MRQSLSWIPGQVVEAALRVPGCVESLDNSLWLYLALVAAANHHGLVVRHVEKLAAALGVSVEQVGEWLARLVEAKLVEVTSPSPFLVIRLRFWSASTETESKNAPENAASQASLLGVPVSSSNAAAAAAASSKQEDGGAGEGEALLREVVSALGEVNIDEIRQLMGRFPAGIVREALRRVESTPPAQIRKSRLALFRYLLGNLS